MKHTNLLTQADRDMFDRIDRDCLAMHVCPPPKTFLKLEIADAHGDTVEVYEDRAHSWVRNAYNVLSMALMGLNSNDGGTSIGGGKMPLYNTSAAICQGNYPILPQYAATNDSLIGAIGVDSSGIVIGSSNAGEAFDYATMNAKIANGNTSGCMAYQAQARSGITSYDPVTHKITTDLVRIFNNNSGAPITVKEVGIVASLPGAGATRDFHLMCRDALAESNWKTVPNAGQLTVTYTIEMTFPG